MRILALSIFNAALLYASVADAQDRTYTLVERELEYLM